MPGKLNMNQREVSRLYTKLDSIDTKFDKKMDRLIGLTEAQEQHLKNLNGTVARHEKQLGHVWKQFQTCSDAKEKKIQALRTGFDMGRGGIKVLSILAIALALVATAISLMP